MVLHKTVLISCWGDFLPLRHFSLCLLPETVLVYSAHFQLYWPKHYVTLSVVFETSEAEAGRLTVLLSMLWWGTFSLRENFLVYRYDCYSCSTVEIEPCMVVFNVVLLQAFPKNTGACDLALFFPLMLLSLPVINFYHTHFCLIFYLC